MNFSLNKVWDVVKVLYVKNRILSFMLYFSWYSQYNISLDGDGVQSIDGHGHRKKRLEKIKRLTSLNVGS